MSTKTLEYIRKMVRLYQNAGERLSYSTRWSTWLLSAIHRFEKDEALRELWDSLVDTSQVSSEELSEAYRKVWLRIDSKQDKTQLRLVSPRTVSSARRLNVIGQYAAAGLVLALSVFGAYIYRQAPLEQPQPEIIAEVQPVVQEAVPVIPALELQIGSNARRVVCPDGSLVWSNAKGKVDYYADRSVKTDEGKVYFEVAKAQSVPFTVYSGDLKATVLGTRFTVVHEKNGVTKFQLHEGNLDITTPHAQLELQAGKTLVYYQKSGEMKVEGLKSFIPDFVASSIMRLESKTYADVFELLTKYFHVDILYDKTLWSRMYITLRLDGTESMNDILYMLKTLEPSFRYQVAHDGTVFVG